MNAYRSRTSTKAILCEQQRRRRLDTLDPFLSHLLAGFADLGNGTRPTSISAMIAYSPQTHRSQTKSIIVSDVFATYD